MSADRENTYFSPEAVEVKSKSLYYPPIVKNIFFLVKDRERDINVVYKLYMLFIVYKSEYYLFRLKREKLIKKLHKLGNLT